MGTLVEFRILGSLEVRVAGRPLPITAHKQRAVLAALILRANEVAQSAYLAEGLWGSEYPASAPSLIKTYIWQLRKLLAGEPGEGQSRISTTHAGYSLRVMGDELDLVRFERLYRQGLGMLSHGSLERAAALLRSGLAMWTGQPLNDTPLVGKLGAEVHALEDLRRTVQQRLISADMQLGRYQDIIPQLRVLAADDPLCEMWHMQLMAALYRSGHRADALHVYKSARETLIAELGVEPSESLRALQKAILNGADDSPGFATGAGGHRFLLPRDPVRRRRAAPLCSSAMSKAADGRDDAEYGDHA